MRYISKLCALLASHALSFKGFGRVLTLKVMQHLAKDTLKSLVKNFQGKRVAVIGDLMLDRYYWSKVTRISPEAPVPVALIKDITFQLGGAANVVNNLLELGAQPLILGVVGDDEAGRELTKLFAEKNLSTDGIIVDTSRPTTVKTRVIAESQQIMRVDREVLTAVDSKVQGHLLDQLRAAMGTLDAVIFEDYNKGVLVAALIEEAIKLAREKNVFVSVDPKFENFLCYKGANLFKPNRLEAERVLGYPVSTIPEVDKAAKDLLTRMQCDNLLITLGEEGMALYRANGEKFSVPALLREIHDPSGAGDTVISVYTLAVASGASDEQAMTLANYAAGIVCGKSGAQPIATEEMLEFLDNIDQVP